MKLMDVHMGLKSEHVAAGLQGEAHQVQVLAERRSGMPDFDVRVLILATGRVLLCLNQGFLDVPRMNMSPCISLGWEHFPIVKGKRDRKNCFLWAAPHAPSQHHTRPGNAG